MNPSLSRILGLLANWLYRLLLLSVLVLPNSIRDLKAWLLGPILIILVPRSFRGSYRRSFFLLLVAYETTMLGFIAYGLTNGAPDFAIPYLLGAYIVGPVFWTFFLADYIRRVGIVSLMRTIVVGSAMAAALLCICFIYFDDLPTGFKDMLVFDARVMLSEGIAGAHFHQISTLIFALPAVFFSLDRAPVYIPGRSRKARALWLVLLLSLFLFATLVSGRTALLLLLVLGGAFGLFRSMRGRIAIAVVGVVAYVLLPIIGIDLVMTSTAHYDKVVAGGGEERVEQKMELIDGFLTHPLFGYGHGLSVPLIRAPEQPWRYELFFHSLLFHTGLVGTAVFAAPIVVSLLLVRRRFRATPSVAKFIIFGTLGVILASFTNPYIESIEMQWSLVLPWAVAIFRDDADGVGVPTVLAPPGA